MPRILRVGCRSIWVDAAAWAQVMLGLLSLALAAGWLNSAVSVDLAACIALLVLSALLVTSGFALQRRLEWGRRLSWVLIATLLPMLLAGPWIISMDAWLALLLSAAISAALLWTLNVLSSRIVLQEFA